MKCFCDIRFVLFMMSLPGVTSHPHEVPMETCMSMNPQQGHGRPPMTMQSRFRLSVVQYPDMYKGMCMYTLKSLVPAFYTQNQSWIIPDCLGKIHHFFSAFWTPSRCANLPTAAIGHCYDCIHVLAILLFKVDSISV